MHYKNLEKTISQENGITYITLKGNCILSGKEYEVTLDEKAFNLMEQGVDIMPLIGPEKMEFLKTGISPDSWNNAFGGNL